MAHGQTTDPRRLAREKTRETVEASQRREDIAMVMSTPGGRRFMYRLIYDDCGLQDQYMAQDSGIYKHEGKRSVGAALAQRLQVEHTEAYILMITERLRDLGHQNQIRDDSPGDSDA